MELYCWLDLYCGISAHLGCYSLELSSLNGSKGAWTTHHMTRKATVKEQPIPLEVRAGLPAYLVSVGQPLVATHMSFCTSYSSFS